MQRSLIEWEIHIPGHSGYSPEGQLEFPFVLTDKVSSEYFTEWKKDFQDYPT